MLRSLRFSYNKPFESSKLDEELARLSKQELIKRLKTVLEKNPDQQKYLQIIDKTEAQRLIKRVWIPRYEYTESFFNEINYIKEQLQISKDFELARLFLNKLIDMRDHDPESIELRTEIDDFIEHVKKCRYLDKAQKTEFLRIAKQTFLA